MLVHLLIRRAKTAVAWVLISASSVFALSPESEFLSPPSQTDRVLDAVQAALEDPESAVDLRPVNAGLLREEFVRHDMAVRRTVNPGREPLTVLYGGAGADISNFMLSTEAAKGCFVAQYHGLSAEHLRRAIEQQRDVVREYKFLSHKFDQGYSPVGDIDSPDKIAEAVCEELRAMGVDLNTVDEEDTQSGPVIRFFWRALGEKEASLREIAFVEADITRPDAYPASLKAILRAGIDIYYQRAGLGIAGTYANPDCFLHAIYDHVKDGGFLVTDDYAFDPGQPRAIYDSREDPYSNKSPLFPLDLPVVPLTDSRIAAVEKKILDRRFLQVNEAMLLRYDLADNPEANYGWHVRVRQKRAMPEMEKFHEEFFAAALERLKRDFRKSRIPFPRAADGMPRGAIAESDLPFPGGPVIATLMTNHPSSKFILLAGKEAGGINVVLISGEEGSLVSRAGDKGRLYARYGLFLNRAGKWAWGRFKEPLLVQGVWNDFLGPLPTINEIPVHQLVNDKLVIKEAFRVGGVATPPCVVLQHSRSYSVQEITNAMNGVLKGNGGWAVKPNFGVSGRDVLMFEPGEKAQAAEYAGNLLKKGDDVLIEDRVQSLFFADPADPDLRRLDWKLRVVMTYDAGGKPLVAAIVVHYRPYGPLPINVARGAESMEWKEFSDWMQWNAKESMAREEQVRAFSARIIGVMENLLAQKGHDPKKTAGLYGLDIMWGAQGLTALEVNTGWGGLRKLEAVAPVARYLAAKADAYGKSLPKIADTAAPWQKYEHSWLNQRYLGSVFNASGNFFRAAESFKKALGKHPVDPELWFDYGHALQKLKNYSQAADAFRMAAALNPQEPNYWLQYGFALSSMGDQSRALDALRRAVDIDKSNPLFYEALAITLFKAGQTEEAFKVYEDLFVSLKDRAMFDAAIEVAQHAAIMDASRAPLWKEYAISATGLKTEKRKADLELPLPFTLSADPVRGTFDTGGEPDPAVYVLEAYGIGREKQEFLPVGGEYALTPFVLPAGEHEKLFSALAPGSSARTWIVSGRYKPLGILSLDTGTLKTEYCAFHAPPEGEALPEILQSLSLSPKSPIIRKSYKAFEPEPVPYLAGVFEPNNPYVETLLGEVLPEVKSGDSVLIPGCGAGVDVVPIAGQAPDVTVDTYDKQPLAVASTKWLAALKGVSERVHAWQGEGFSSAVPAGKKYDLIVVNLPVVIGYNESMPQAGDANITDAGGEFILAILDGYRSHLKPEGKLYLMTVMGTENGWLEKQFERRGLAHQRIYHGDDSHRIVIRRIKLSSSASEKEGREAWSNNWGKYMQSAFGSGNSTVGVWFHVPALVENIEGLGRFSKILDLSARTGAFPLSIASWTGARVTAVRNSSNDWPGRTEIDFRLDGFVLPGQVTTVENTDARSMPLENFDLVRMHLPAGAREGEARILEIRSRMKPGATLAVTVGDYSGDLAWQEPVQGIKVLAPKGIKLKSRQLEPGDAGSGAIFNSL